MGAVVLLLELRRGKIAQRFQDALRVAPGDPIQCRVLHFIKALPRPPAMDHLRLKNADDRLGQRVIVRIANAADRRRGAGVGQPGGVAHRDVLRAAVRVDHQAFDQLPIMQGLNERTRTRSVRIVV